MHEIVQAQLHHGKVEVEKDPQRDRDIQRDIQRVASNGIQCKSSSPEDTGIRLLEDELAKQAAEREHREREAGKATKVVVVVKPGYQSPTVLQALNMSKREKMRRALRKPSLIPKKWIQLMIVGITTITVKIIITHGHMTRTTTSNDVKKVSYTTTLMIASRYFLSFLLK